MSMSSLRLWRPTLEWLVPARGEKEPACGVEGRLTMEVPGESVLALAGVLW